MVRIRELSDPLGLLRFDLPPFFVKVVVECFARLDHLLQLLSVQLELNFDVVILFPGGSFLNRAAGRE